MARYDVGTSFANLSPTRRPAQGSGDRMFARRQGRKTTAGAWREACVLWGRTAITALPIRGVAPGTARARTNHPKTEHAATAPRPANRGARTLTRQAE